MPSLREAMSSIAKSTSKILSPDLQSRVVRALSDLEVKYENSQGKLREALHDKVSLENEVLYLKNKLEDAKKEVQALREKAAKAIAPTTKKAKPKAKAPAKAKPKAKVPAKKKTTKKKK
tara:strand:- start:1369 stop:1725 length:357 start_codon:yes stop_codon:yes gene_type:complete